MLKRRVTIVVIVALTVLLLGAGALLSPVILLHVLRFLPIAESGRALEAQTEESTATLALPKEVARAVKGVRLTAVPTSAWPATAVGGLYEVSPDGASFDAPVPFIVTFAAAPPPGVTLGYWHGERQMWEYLPTLRRAPAVLETRLRHASQIGGYQPLPQELADAAPPTYADPQTAALDKELRETLKRLARAQFTGDEDAERRERERLHQLLSELADRVIAACLQHPTADAQYAFFYVWAMADTFELSEIAAKFERTERECRPREEPPPRSSYVIDQTDTFPVTFSVPGPAVAAKLTGTQTVVSRGTTLPGSSLTPGGHAWQTTWEVFQDSDFESTGVGQIRFPEVTSTEFSGQGYTTDHVRLLFSLVAVKEGASFPIRVIRRGTYEEVGTGPIQDITIFHKKRPVYHAPVDPNYQETIEGGAITITGILKKDLGTEGADIAFGDVAVPGASAVEGLPSEFAALQQSVSSQLSAISRNSPPLRIRRTGEPSPSPPARP